MFANRDHHRVTEMGSLSMGYYIKEAWRSYFKDGIETIIIPLKDKRAIASLVFATKRGGQHDVVEFLLSEIGRDYELERVCGLAVGQEGDLVVCQIQMRQPGLQLEEWLKEHRQLNIVAAGADLHSVVYDGETKVGELSSRAMSHDRFTDKTGKWWDKPLVPMEQWSYLHKEIKEQLGVV